MINVDSLRADLKAEAYAYADSVYPNAPGHVRDGLVFAWLHGHKAATDRITRMQVEIQSARALDAIVSTEVEN